MRPSLLTESVNRRSLIGNTFRLWHPEETWEKVDITAHKTRGHFTRLFFYDDDIRALKKLGFIVTRRRGSHIVLRKDDLGCVIPDHRELKAGTLLYSALRLLFHQKLLRYQV